MTAEEAVSPMGARKPYLAEGERVMRPLIRRVRRTTPIAVVTLAVLLTGCAQSPTVPAEPKSSTKPTAAPSTTPTESTSSNTAEPSGIVVDYDSFANWDNRNNGYGPGAAHLYEGSREWTCDQFFTANGIPEYEGYEHIGAYRGEELMNWYMPRFELAWNLNNDLTDERNGEVAQQLLDCLAPPGSEAYAQISRMFQANRASSMGPFPAPVIDHITRQSTNPGPNGYVVEYATEDPIDGTIYPQMVFQFTESLDWRLSQWNEGYSEQGDSIFWGNQPPTVLDPAREDAPYELG